MVVELTKTASTLSGTEGATNEEIHDIHKIVVNIYHKSGNICWLNFRVKIFLTTDNPNN